MNSSIKPYYYEEIKTVSEKIIKEKGDFVFSLIADSHLDNSIDESLRNIKEVDKIVNFKCLVHLGDFLNGNIPSKYTAEVLRNEMTRFRKAISNGVFYPAQGNHDGYTELVAYRANDIAIDEDWYRATKFVNDYNNVSRPEQKPYFYVDYPKEKIRLIILCSFHYEFVESKFVKKYGVSDEQIDWLKNDALDLGADWTVMFFSHDFAFSSFDDEKVKNDNSRINGQRLVEVMNSQRNKNKFDIAAWFIGHFHGDVQAVVKGINVVLVASQTAYVPQLFSMPMEIYPDRILYTVTEDLWDTAVLNKKERTIKLIRFGAGNDRMIKY